MITDMKKTIKNPLKKRWMRELMGDKGKYLALFLFLTLTIGFVAGYLVADNSMLASYDESFEKYNVEDGHFSLAVKMPSSLKKNLEDEDVIITKQYYKDENISGSDITTNGKADPAGSKKTVRIFRIRDSVNRSCLMKGRMPEKKNEIVIDRLFAENNGIDVGDKMKVDGMNYEITGLVALPDYSALFKNNSDMMFNATKFTVALMNRAGFERIDDDNLVYQYAWTNKKAAGNDTASLKKKNDKIEDILKDSMLLTDFVKRDDNQAIIFAGDDMGSDKSMFVTMLYIVIVIMAFVFGVTTKSMIEQEAQTIGTLRASGYTKGELLRHYLKLPVMVVATAAVIGNILGYTWMKQIVVDMYMHSYSLTKYKTLWNGEAFVLTTVIPSLIILVVTFLMLVRMLRLPPLQFLRRELTGKKKDHAARLPGWSFMNRFRMRVILQNRMAYLILTAGIMLASLLLIFGMCLLPLMENFRDDVKSSQIAKYQYVLKAPVNTEKSGAEKYCVTSLRVNDKEDVMIYGVSRHSEYAGRISLPAGKNEALISEGYAEKYGIHTGDTISLKETYGKKRHRFKVTGTYDYPASLAVFMSRSSFNEKFDHEKGYFNGYFSDKKLTDIDDSMIASTITLSDMTLIYDQLKDSFGAILPMFRGFAVVIYVLLLYLLAKVVVDKNKQNISLLKILGYNSSEAGRIYNYATAAVVTLALVATTPLAERMMKILYYIFMKDINGWMPYYIPGWLYVAIPCIGMGCYLVIHLLLSAKIRRVRLAQALRSME